jgi:hypothetical protein
MNLQESIRRILKEESSITDKLKTMIDKFGVLNTIRAVGNYSKFKKLYGDNITKSEMIELISEIVKRYGEENGDYIDVRDHDIFVNTRHNNTDYSKYITEVIDIYVAGFYTYKQYGYDEDMGEYDWENYYDGAEKLKNLSISELDNIINVLSKIKKF